MLRQQFALKWSVDSIQQDFIEIDKMILNFVYGYAKKPRRAKTILKQSHRLTLSDF